MRYSLRLALLTLSALSLATPPAQASSENPPLPKPDRDL